MAMQLSRQISGDFDVPARMRDGTILNANIYRPAGDGRWPVLLTRLPYGKDLPEAGRGMDPVQAARRGYVVIVQDTRGRFASSGEWDPFQHETLDGIDTVEWAAKLPFSDGNVGMFGGSYSGFTQWAAATQNPPALKAMVPFITWDNPLNGMLFRGGALELGAAGTWHTMMGINALMRRYRGDPDPRTIGRALNTLIHDMDTLGKQGYWSLPMKEFEPIKHNDISPFFFETIEHPMDWAQADPLTLGSCGRCRTVSRACKQNGQGPRSRLIQDSPRNILPAHEGWGNAWRA